MDYKEKRKLIETVKHSVYSSIIESAFEEESDFDNMMPQQKLQLHTIIRYGKKLESKFVA